MHVEAAGQREDIAFDWAREGAGRQASPRTGHYD